MINVLIVDDSAFMRKLISDILGEEKNITIVGKARDGKDAIEKVKKLHPDVVTMDVEMPKMNGIDAVERIMEENPVPIIMLSSLTKEGADATISALEKGAVDFIPKPKSIFKVKDDSIKNEIVEKIRIASKIKLKKPPKRIVLPRKKVEHIEKSNRLQKIIAIGTSTGGPRALQRVIPKIPGDINAAILIVQHMPPGFTKSLAERLNKISEIDVKEAEGNEELKPGYAFIAPGGKHLKVRKKRNKLYTYLEDSELVSGHKPSVDAMYDSIVQNKLDNVIGVIMTGMGSDGATQMRELRRLKNYTIAQNEETCVVYGMPKSAVDLGAVDEVVSLDDISEAIIKAMEV